MGQKLDESVKVGHGGIDIIYSEEENIWRFELYGKERRADTLANARKAIDAPPPKDKGQKFERFKAWKLTSWSDELEEVEVTSKAADENSFWISKDGERRKEGAWSLIKICEENKKKHLQIKELTELVKKSNKEIEELKRAYARIEVPKDV